MCQSAYPESGPICSRDLQNMQYGCYAPNCKLRLVPGVHATRRPYEKENNFCKAVEEAVSEGPRIGIWIYLSACHPVGRCHGEHTNRSKLHHHGNYAVPRGYLSLLSTAVLSREVPAVQFLLFTS